MLSLGYTKVIEMGLVLKRYLPPAPSVYHVHTWCPGKSEDGVESSGARVTDSCELSCGCWELNLDPLEGLLSHGS